jgi:hypothetical protein
VGVTILTGTTPHKEALFVFSFSITIKASLFPMLEYVCV